MGELKKRLDRIEELFDNISNGDPVANIDEIYNCINVVNKLVALKAANFIADDNITVADSHNNSLSELGNIPIIPSNKPNDDEKIIEGDKIYTKEELEKKKELEGELETLKEELHEQEEITADLQKDFVNLMPDSIKDKLENGVTEENMTESGKAELDEVEMLSEMEIDDVVNYILKRCHIKLSYVGCKYVRALGKICNDDHNFNTTVSFEEMHSKMEEYCNTSWDKIAKAIDNLISHANFADCNLVDFKRMDPNYITPEVFLREFIEFYQYEENEEEVIPVDEP